MSTDWKNANIGLSARQWASKYWKQVVFGLGGLLIIFTTIWISTVKPQMPIEYKQAIDSLTNANKDLINRQNRLDSAIEVYEEKVREVDFQIDNIKEKTTIVREYYHEVGQQAGRYTPTQVDSFFKARYNY